MEGRGYVRIARIASNQLESLPRNDVLPTLQEHAEDMKYLIEMIPYLLLTCEGYGKPYALHELIVESCPQTMPYASPLTLTGQNSNSRIKNTTVATTISRS